jgi:hypothetical protein
MIVNKLNKKDFLAIVDTLDYKDKDEAEAKEFGSDSVKDSNHRANHWFAKYYTIVHDNKVIATIILQRDGFLVYFVTKDFTPNLTRKLIRTVKQLADDTIASVENIFTKTALSYDEALRFNKLVGFRLYLVSNSWTIWIYDGK